MPHGNNRPVQEVPKRQADAPRIDDVTLRLVDQAPEITLHERHRQWASPNGALINSDKLEVGINNPIMNGAVPHWKATAHKLAAQAQALLHQADKHHKSISYLESLVEKTSERANAQFAGKLVAQGRLAQAQAIQDVIREHWSFFLLPRLVKERLMAVED